MIALDEMGVISNLDRAALDLPPLPELSYHTPVPKAPVRWSWQAAAQLVLGVAIVAAIVVPWFVLVRHRAPEFLEIARQEAASGRDAS